MVQMRTGWILPGKRLTLTELWTTINDQDYARKSTGGGRCP